MSLTLEKRAMAKPEVSLESLFSETRPGLALVEERIASVFVTDAPVLHDIAHYLLKQGGKRVRPMLALTAARLFQSPAPSQQLVDAAAGIELIHMATLLHDDIIDQSPTRRHKPSAFRQYGMTPSLLTGDFLLVRAFGLCAMLDQFVITRTEQACVELTEGEVLEGHLDPTAPHSFESYVNIISKKTASLFSLAAAVGAHYANASREEVELISQFGNFAGITFQMVDDILDIVAEEDLLGKPSGTDLKQRTPSLINILWLSSGDREAARFFSRETVSEQEARSALEYLRGSNVVAQAREVAVEFADKSKNALNAIRPERIDPRVRAQLDALIDYTLHRVS